MEQLESSRRQSSRVSQALERYGTWYCSNQVDIDDILVDDSGEVLFTYRRGVPSSFKEALSGKDKLKWNSQSLHIKDLHASVKLPRGMVLGILQTKLILTIFQLKIQVKRCSRRREYLPRSRRH